MNSKNVRLIQDIMSQRLKDITNQLDKAKAEIAYANQKIKEKNEIIRHLTNELKKIQISDYNFQEDIVYGPRFERGIQKGSRQLC